MNTDFKFNELIWVSPERVSQPGEWAKEDREHIHLIRDLHPELKCWGDLAIGLA
jgi:hypothetical protein